MKGNSEGLILSAAAGSAPSDVLCALGELEIKAEAEMGEEEVP